MFFSISHRICLSFCESKRSAKKRTQSMISVLYAIPVQVPHVSILTYIVHSCSLAFNTDVADSPYVSSSSLLYTFYPFDEAFSSSSIYLLPLFLLDLESPQTHAQFVNSQPHIIALSILEM